MLRHRIRRRAVELTARSRLEPIIRGAYELFAPTKAARYDRQTNAIMRRVLTATSNAIDVGCYRGQVLRKLLLLSPAGKVFAFEPIPECYEYLRRAFPAADVSNLALLDRQCSSSFIHVLGREARSGLQRQRYPDPTQELRIISVQCDRLDNLIPPSARIAFIKIDVEGAEGLVLRGGHNLILRDRPTIIFEHIAEMARTFNQESGDLFDFLTLDCGLSVNLMKRWLLGEGPLDRQAFVGITQRADEFYFMAYSPDGARA